MGGRRADRADGGERARHQRQTGRARDQTDDPAVHRAFRRMAFLFANLVCAIWLVLLTGLMVLDPDRPEVGSLVIVLLVSAPIAYAVPYAVVRLAGLVTVMVRRRARRGPAAPPGG